MDDFKKVQEWLKHKLKNKCKFDNLGGRSKGFYAQYNSNSDSIDIEVIKTNTHYTVSWEHLYSCFERYKSLPENDRRETGSYTDPKWTDCPNRITMPYVAKLIKEFFEHL